MTRHPRRRGETEFGIASTAFLEHAFRTDAYRLEVTFHPDGSWSYGGRSPSSPLRAGEEKEAA